ncbi:MAG: carbohydrate-binding family 6 protein [Cyclobacteriaceae bacterium]
MRPYNVTLFRISPLQLHRFLGKRITVFYALCFTLSVTATAQSTVSIFNVHNSPMVDFALNDLKDELYSNQTIIKKTGVSDATLLLITKSDISSGKSSQLKYPKVDFDLKAEGFVIKKDKQNKIWVIGADEPGLMYGILELVEQVQLYGMEGIKETNQNPYMKTRGTKFNLPLDVRTPTYTDPSEASNQNMLEMWSMDFWTEYIDKLARDRYNMISLWSLHPFPSMLKVPDYPEVALDDVWRTTHSTSIFRPVGNGVKYPNISANTEVIKQITIEEKIEYWQRVMSYAKDRNVDIFLMVWNIFDWGIDEKYGITEKPENPVTRDYFRKSVKQMLLTYPDLSGIGLTVGENMAGYEGEVKEEWAFDTYGKGVLEALELDPDRKITFIHRLHQGDVKLISNQFAPLIDHKNVNFIFSFKYAQAHIMSSTRQPYADDFVKEIGGMKTLWTLRNDDNYYFRWGGVKFLREFIKNIPYDVSEGFYYGSDGYVWGRDFMSKNERNPRELDIKKHWYHWMSMGRLGYNPGLADQRFAEMLKYRFPEADDQSLFTAWQEASMVYPVTTGFHWGPADFSWYIEGCMSRKGHPTASIDQKGIHHVDQFIQQPVHPGTNNQTIPDYVEMVMAGETSDLTTPLQVAEKLHGHADKALELLMGIGQFKDETLSKTVEDIWSISYLGKYYAHKISGSTHVAFYRKFRKKEHQDKAVEELEMALDYCKKFTENASKQHINPMWMKRVGMADWMKFIEHAEQDIETAKQIID